MTEMSRQRAVEVQEAVKALEAIPDAERTDAENRALERGRAMLGQAQQTQSAYDARYRGFQRGATLGLSDNIAGVVGAVTGDSEARGASPLDTGIRRVEENYRAAQGASLEKDQAASVLDPEGFDKGEMAGNITAAASTLGFGPSLTGAHMLTKMGAGGLGGLAFGALQGESDYEMAGSPDGQRWDYLRGPMAVGGGTGAAVYPIGQIAGALTRGGRNAIREGVEGFGRMPTRTMARAAQNTQDSGLDIATYLDGLTPEATLADVPGSLRTRAQGLAKIGGEGGDKVRRTVVERGETAGARIANDLDQNITGPNAAFNEQRRLAAERTGKLGPEYDAALAARDPVDVTDTLAIIESRLKTAGPDSRAILQRYYDDLLSRAENGQISAESLHWLRSDLSDAITGGPTKSNALLQDALRAIDDDLDTVPGYAEARTGYANNKAMERAIENGQGALRGGRASALSPAELAEEFGKLSDAEREAFRAGLRRDVAALMGTSRNDAAAAWGEFAKGWNAEKLRIVLGDEAAEPIIKRLRSEQVFSQTRGRVDAGSATSENQQAAADLADYMDPETGRNPGPFVRAKRQLDNAGNAVVDALIYGPRRSRANADLGQMLSVQGPERDRLLVQLLLDAQKSKAPSASDAIVGRIARALTAGGGAYTAN